MALLNATCSAFNHKSLKMYILDCFLWLTSGLLQNPLECYIRIDIAHLIEIICRKKTFNSGHPRVKDFFVRCVGIMSICEDIEDFSELLLSVLIVAGSQYGGKNSTGKK